MSSTKKAVQKFAELAKVDPSLSAALAAFRQAGLHEQANVVARHLFSDQMISRLGNKAAYGDFLKRHGNSGCHIHLDGNNFGIVNKQFGEQVGDGVIRTIGNHVADVSRMFGGKAFRNGGDEFKIHFSKPEQAHGFARELRNRLDKEPLVGNKLKLSASMGIGHNPTHAEAALQNAKKQLGPTDPISGKRQNIHGLHETPTVTHSLLHEEKPKGWKPSKGGPETVSAPRSHVPHGLTLNNPLAGT
jgi:diguanylate cyclase (GGDEF)-like protein